MRCEAFTLLELLIALAILAAGVGASLLAARDFNDRRALISAQNALTGSLRFARAYALLSRQSVTLCASTDGANCGNSDLDSGWIIFSERPGKTNSKRDPGETVLSVQHALPGQLRLKTRNISRHLRFLPNGRAHRAGRMTLCHSSNSRYRFTAVITTAGLVRRAHPDDPDNACAA